LTEEISFAVVWSSVDADLAALLVATARYTPAIVPPKIKSKIMATKIAFRLDIL
jgi:hypothetical protein